MSDRRRYLQEGEEPSSKVTVVTGQREETLQEKVERSKQKTFASPRAPHRVKARNRCVRRFPHPNHETRRHNSSPSLPRLAVQGHNIVLVRVKPGLCIFAKVYHGLQRRAGVIGEWIAVA